MSTLLNIPQAIAQLPKAVGNLYKKSLQWVFFMFQTLSDLYRFVPGPFSWESFTPWEVSTGVGVVLHQLLKVIVRSGISIVL